MCEMAEERRSLLRLAREKDYFDLKRKSRPGRPLILGIASNITITHSTVTITNNIDNDSNNKNRTIIATDDPRDRVPWMSRPDWINQIDATV